MAENDVHITGSDPDWAIEKALDNILTTLKGTQKVSKSQEKKLKEAASGGKVFDKKAFSDFHNGLKKTTAGAFAQGRANKSLHDTTKDLNKEFKESSKSIKGLAIGVGGVAAILGTLYQQFMDTLGTFRELQDVGLSVNLEYMQVTKNLALMGMSLDQFQAVSQRFATSIGKMGLDNFTNLITSVGEGFHTFGLTMSEGSEWAAEYIDQQRLLANNNIYTQQGLNKAVRSNIDRLTAYSKILNVSRSELQSARTEAAQDGMVQARFLAEGAEMASSARDAYMDFNSRFAALDAPEMGQIFRDMMGFRDVSMSDEFQRVMESSASEVGLAIAGITESIAYNEGELENSAENMNKVGRASVAFMQSRGYQLLQANPNDPTLLAISKFARNWKAAFEGGTLDPNSDVNKMNKVAAELNTNLDRLKGTALVLGNVIVEKVIKLLGGGSIDGTMTGGMQAVADAAGAAADWLMKLAEGKVEWGKVFANIGSWIWDGIGGMFTSLWEAGVATIREGIDNVVRAIQNWNPLSKASYATAEYVQDSAYGSFAQKAARFAQGNMSDTERQQQMVQAQRTHRENNIRTAMKDRADAQADLALYNTGGVTASARAGGDAMWNATIQPLLDQIAESNRILKENKKALDKLNDTAESGNG